MKSHLDRERCPGTYPPKLCYGQRCSYSGEEIPSSKVVKVTLLPHFSPAGVVRGNETKIGSVGERANADQPFLRPSSPCPQASVLTPRQSFLSNHTWLLLASYLSLTWRGFCFETCFSLWATTLTPVQRYQGCPRTPQEPVWARPGGVTYGQRERVSQTHP